MGKFRASWFSNEFSERRRNLICCSVYFFMSQHLPGDDSKIRRNRERRRGQKFAGYRRDTFRTRKNLAYPETEQKGTASSNNELDRSRAMSDFSFPIALTKNSKWNKNTNSARGKSDSRCRRIAPYGKRKNAKRKVDKRTFETAKEVYYERSLFQSGNAITFRTF